VLQPLLMPTFGIIVMLFTSIPEMYIPLWKWYAVIGTFLFTALLPATPILIMMQRGELRDLYISKKEQRTIPYLFSLLAYTFWTIFLWRVLRMPPFVVAMGVGATMSIVIITIINLRWKISAHLSGIGGLAGGIFAYSFVMFANPLPLLIAILGFSALTALSRIGLKAHTPGQTLAGFAVGFLLVFLPAVFTGI